MQLLGKRLGVERAPFFVVRDDQGETVYTSMLQLIQARFGQEVTSEEQARDVDPDDVTIGVLSRLTLPGSMYLAMIAVLPTFLIQFFNFSQATSTFLGGTSLLIIVGVALDTMRQMESQMMMRSYEGFLK